MKTMPGTGEIDALIVAAHWRYLHSVWIDNAEGEKAALDEIDLLLEARYLLVEGIAQ